MSALVTAVLATALAVGAPLADPADATGAPQDGAVATTGQVAPLEAARHHGRLVDLGVDECAWDVSDRGVVVTSTHLVRHGRVLPLPGGLTGARFVNERGQVAGDVDGRAAFWDGARLWFLNPLRPGDAFVTVTALSDRGELVGTSSAGGGDAAAFRWRAGVMTPLAGLGGRTDANDVNDRGQVVGAAWVDGVQHAVRWEADGRLVRLPGLGDDTGSSLATAIDTDGRAAGYSYVSAGSGDMRPVRWSRSGAVADLGLAGGTGSVADLSDLGRAVGSIALPETPQQAFVQDRGRAVRLVSAEDGTLVFTAVNHAGLVVGCVFTDDGGERAVVWR